MATRARNVPEDAEPSQVRWARTGGATIPQTQPQPGDAQNDAQGDAPRYARDTFAFGRVANLSDAVFAIAMTLLVLTLDVPTTQVHRLSEALVDQLPQFVAFALSFGLVANLWWQHHRLIDLLEALEPVAIGINLTLLAFVALVPYPTSLLGVAPGSGPVVTVFIAVFVVLTALHLILLLRAGARGLIREDVPRDRYLILAGGYGAGIVVLLIALLVALWSPTIALVVVAAAILLGPLGARRSNASLERAYSYAAARRDGAAPPKRKPRR